MVEFLPMKPHQPTDQARRRPRAASDAAALDNAGTVGSGPGRGAWQSIVVLTGAGISAESGIRTFRAADGLWESHRIEDVASPEGFERNPQLVHHFYNQRRQQLLSDSVRPNAAHQALARFEEQFPGKFLLITQNIDDLHERAGSRQLRHMHGELLKMRCQQSQRVFDIRMDLSFDTLCPCCGVTGNLRPHIVWFGEMPFQMPQIMQGLRQCDLFVSVGTSGNVYPAAGFHQAARDAGAHTVELNLEKTTSHFDEHIYGPATEVVPAYFDALLSDRQGRISL
jgi:NAD-dependent deacetylase